MAATEFRPGVPADVSERFLPEESPMFELVRAEGAVRLWRSTTTSHFVGGLERPSRVHYHVTTGDQADYVLMPRLATAVANFEMVSAEARGSAA